MEFKINNTAVYGLNESAKASGYPMSTYTECDADFGRLANLGSAKQGSGHDCATKGIVVQADIAAPQYWWLQEGRYHFIDIVSSQSKMHRITKMDIDKQCNGYVDKEIIKILNNHIDMYNGAPNQNNFQWVMSNCPMGLMLTARVVTNYLQLKSMYNQRKNHRLEEWHMFCDWADELPRFNELTGCRR